MIIPVVLIVGEQPQKVFPAIIFLYILAANVVKNIAMIAAKDQALPVPNVIQHHIQITIRFMQGK